MKGLSSIPAISHFFSLFYKVLLWQGGIWYWLFLWGILKRLRWLNTVLAVCEYTSFAKSWQEKGYNSQAETWQVKKYTDVKYFDWQVKCDFFVVSMVTWTLGKNLKISLLNLHKVRSLDFPINLHTAYYN